MLKKITSNYDSKCSKCGRELKKGWNIFFDTETKDVYCTKCQADADSQPEAKKQIIKINSGFTGFCQECGMTIISEDCCYYIPDDDMKLCESCGKAMVEPDKTQGLRLEMQSVKQSVNNLVSAINNLAGILLEQNEQNKKIESNTLAILTNQTVTIEKLNRLNLDTKPKETAKKD